MVLNNGKWAHQTIVGDATYLKVMKSPSQQLNPSYGYLWWLNGQESLLKGNRRIKGLACPSSQYHGYESQFGLRLTAGVGQFSTGVWSPSELCGRR